LFVSYTQSRLNLRTIERERDYSGYAVSISTIMRIGRVENGYISSKAERKRRMSVPDAIMQRKIWIYHSIP
jgi:hypothetical protein